MAVATTTTTANRSHVEGLNGFVSMRTSIVVRHRNVDGVHLITGPAGGGGHQIPRVGAAETRSGSDFYVYGSGDSGRGLRLRRKWRDVVDPLRLVLIRAPDVSARTAKVRDIRVHAWERQIVGGVLATRRTGRTGRTRHGGKSSFPARNVPAKLQAICTTLCAADSFVSPNS